MSQTTAELVVQEDEYYGTFEIKSYFFGEIRIKLYKDSQELLTLEFGDLEDLFPREKGFRKDARGIFRITRGECKARFGVSQKVELHAKLLPHAHALLHQSQQQQQRKSNDPLDQSRNNSFKDNTTSGSSRNLPNGTDL